ncbi:putative lipoprotein YiaD precursor [mine drainage metagenome]|jgi:outer membrane protein OmpA-like peptidoglycan-associated protein|uniref:Putative lipoprotein YiaD n=1 Tax=mine drainage metagenome TaxID=410659 RepID=A0A1J5RB39_9ZZZZ
MNKPHRSIVVVATAATLALAGCADMNQSQRSTAQGAGIGAAAGAVLGALTAGGNTGSSAMQGAALGAAVGAAGGYLWNQHLEKQKQQMQAASAGTGVQVSQTADNRLKINVPADAGFAVGSAALSPRLQPVLAQLADGLRSNPSETVQIVGYTDSTGGDAINVPLSRSRARSVRDDLVARGVAAQRVTTAGMGAADPVASNATAAGRALNRRVEIFVAYPR